MMSAEELAAYKTARRLAKAKSALVIVPPSQQVDGPFAHVPYDGLPADPAVVSQASAGGDGGDGSGRVGGVGGGEAQPGPGRGRAGSGRGAGRGSGKMKKELPPGFIRVPRCSSSGKPYLAIQGPTGRVMASVGEAWCRYRATDGAHVAPHIGAAQLETERAISDVEVEPTHARPVDGAQPPPKRLKLAAPILQAAPKLASSSDASEQAAAGHSWQSSAARSPSLGLGSPDAPQTISSALVLAPPQDGEGMEMVREIRESLTAYPVNRLPSPAPRKLTCPAGLATLQVREMLERFRLGAYAAAFEEQGYDDKDFLLRMGEAGIQRLIEHVAMKPGHADKYRTYLEAERQAAC